MISAKEQLFRNYVKEIATGKELDVIPNVKFYDGYIPFKDSNVQACIDTTNHIIHVSRHHLMTMDRNDIRQVVIHELSHYKEKSHNTDFDRDMVNTSQGTWTPDSTSGLVMTTSKSKEKTKEIELTQKQIRECEKFHEIAQQRLLSGVPEKTAYADKPKYYTIWAKKHFKKTGGIKLGDDSKYPKLTCYNCGKEFPENWRHCPKCKAFNPKANKYR